MAGRCELATTTHVKTAWKKFKEKLPVLSSHHLQDPWSFIQLMCLECNASSKQDLALDKASSNVRSAMCAASQLPGGERTDVDDVPAPAY